MQKKRAIKVGVFGVGRGKSFMGVGARANGLQLTSICDKWEEKLIEVAKANGVEAYTDFDEFLKSDIEAVVLANYFHEHAPYAIRALKAGKHVISECTACFTMAEGVALARAVEKSGLIYMFAENYPYMNYNQEMKRLYDKGEVGELKHAECEYVHPEPPEVWADNSLGFDHWRNWLPSTYYCTHSIAPVIYITNTRPTMVNAFVVAYDKDDPGISGNYRINDSAATLMLRMDNGATVKSLHGWIRGHAVYTRIHGNRGLMENSRHGDRQRLIISKGYDVRQYEPHELVYKPDFPVDQHLVKNAGHGGGDYFTLKAFADAIRTKKQPFLDVYKGIDMSLCAIQGWRSALEDGAPYVIPDFRKESERKKYVNDHWSPDVKEKRAKFKAPNSILGEIKQTKQAISLSEKVWKAKGYKA